MASENDSVTGLTEAPRSHLTVALAGVGGDAHSVGLIILTRSLKRAGFRVRSLGTQNTVEDVCDAAGEADAVLVSNMDGHAAHYLADLPCVRAQRGGDVAIWYLGGNPSTEKTAASLQALRALGFDRVFAEFVSVSEVIATLDRDLAGRRRNVVSTNWDSTWPGATEPRRRPGDTEDPLSQREAVLSAWRTGQTCVDLEANALVLAGVTTLHAAQARADASGRLLLHPRCGVADLAEQRQIFQDLVRAGADVLSFQIDSLTRNNRYGLVERALAGAASSERRLNGFPAVNHGGAAIRDLVRGVAGLPVQVRHSTRDPRLLAEVAFAGGVTGFEGGAITYNLPYYRDYHPQDAIAAWRYVDRLCGTYAERFGLILNREFFGTLTATLVPPCLAIAACVLEALLAAQQGVRSVSLGYAEQGHRGQDVAAILAARNLGRRYLDRYGYEDVQVITVFHQFMGAFPMSRSGSEKVLAESARTAALSGATRVMTKTIVEAQRIPTGSENADSLALIRQAVAGGGEARLDHSSVGTELEIIERETSAILDAALGEARHDFAEAVALAIRGGLLDVPFSPSIWNGGRAVAVRDGNGAVRFAETGSIPLPPDLRTWHREKVEARLSTTGATLEELVEGDVLQLVRTPVVEWPMDCDSD